MMAVLRRWLAWWCIPSPVEIPRAYAQHGSVVWVERRGEGERSTD